LLTVTAGNLRQNHFYLSRHYDLFPGDCFGPPQKSGDSTREIEILFDGLEGIVRTDIPTDADGKPRGFFRDRGAIRRFYEYHGVTAGEQLAVERVSPRRFRVSIAREDAERRRRPIAAEFFSGIGLVRLALEAQDWSVGFANDIDPDKAEMYRHNWESDDHLVVGDIHQLDPDSIPACDLFTASFPCNDLSIAGKWAGIDGKESSAFFGFTGLLEKLGDRRPPLVLLENVVGFLLSNQGADFERALAELNRLGYVVDAFILNAVHWTPQSRARLFIVARRDDGKPCRRTAAQSKVRPDALCQFINTTTEIRWDIRSLPSPPPATARLADIVEDLPSDDPQWWNNDRVDYFMAQLSERHATDAQRMIDGRTITYATAFRRVRYGKSMAELRTDGIAGCLRTPRGGSGRQILFKAGRGKFQVRLLSARECARLQGVPDTYKIDVPLNQALFGFGDAVCVPAVEWIVTNYLHAATENR